MEVRPITVLDPAQRREVEGIADGSVLAVSEAGADAVELLLGHAGELEQRVRHMSDQLVQSGRIIDTLKDQRDEARKEADHWREIAEGGNER